MKISGSIIAFLVLYLDNMLLIGDDNGMLSSAKTWLSSTFFMKDLGEATYILGIHVYRDRAKRLLGLSQTLYINKVLKSFSIEASKRRLLPFRHGIHLLKSMCANTNNERVSMEAIPYALTIRSLMYAIW